MRGLLRRRRAPSRHALGAAVTGIPSAPTRVALPPEPSAVPEVPAPRVELGFRDGSAVDLEPSSPQAQALQELAQLLRAGD